MKPQTGILSSAHSYSKQYVQFHVESECAVASHTGLHVKVPDIQQYTHSTVLVSSLGTGSLAVLAVKGLWCP